MPTDLPERVLAALGHLVLQYTGAGMFTVKGVVPDWTERFPRTFKSKDVHVLVLVETMPFLESAFVDLDRLWSTARGAVSELGEWVEVDESGRELHLKATVVSSDDDRALILSLVDERMVELLRRARRMASTP